MGIHLQPIKWLKSFWQWLRDVWWWIGLVFRLWKLRHDGTWSAARHAVDAIMNHAGLQLAAQSEPQIQFCPMCGQIPDGDRRMDQARYIAIGILGKQPKRSELDAAISLAYWVRKAS